jgi:hypothetical protein
MDGLALERHRPAEGGNGFGRKLFFEAGRKTELAGVDNQLAHAWHL